MSRNKMVCFNLVCSFDHGLQGGEQFVLCEHSIDLIDAEGQCCFAECWSVHESQISAGHQVIIMKALPVAFEVVPGFADRVFGVLPAATFREGSASNGAAVFSAHEDRAVARRAFSKRDEKILRLSGRAFEASFSGESATVHIDVGKHTDLLIVKELDYVEAALVRWRRDRSLKPTKASICRRNSWFYLVNRIIHDRFSA